MKKRFLQIGLTVILTGAVLFISAGTLRWWMAWYYLLAVVLILTVSGIGLMRTNPQLIADRSQPQEGTPAWDSILVIAYGVLGYVELLIAGLDHRFEWTPAFPVWISIGALIFFVAADLFSVWAMITNAHFETTVRIQDNGEHEVIDSGPYRWIRHPGYAGWGVCHLMIPFIFSSWYAFIPVALVIAILIIRTIHEDRTLQEQLPGYSDYSTQTQYRILPGIW